MTAKTERIEARVNVDLRLALAKRAKRDRLSESEVVRLALAAWLGVVR